MSEVIHLSKRFNHRWKTDPAFEKGFDYDQPKYANVPDSLKWAAPLHALQNTPEFIQEATRLKGKAQRKLDAKKLAIRRSRLRTV